MPANRRRATALAALVLPVCLAALSLAPGPKARANGVPPEYSVQDAGFSLDSYFEGDVIASVNASGQVAATSVPADFGGGAVSRGSRRLPRGPQQRPGGVPPRASRVGVKGAYAPSFTAHLSNAALDSLTDLGTLGGPYSLAHDLNDSGQVVGYAFDASFYVRAFRYPLSGGSGRVAGQSTLLQDLGDLGAPFAIAYGINATGVVVGGSALFEGPTQAFRFVDAAMPEMQGLGALVADRNSIALGVNNAGVIVGWSEDADYAPQPVRFVPGGMPAVQPLGTLGGSFGYATEVNNQSPALIVGYSATPGGGGCAPEADPAGANCVVIDGPTHAFRRRTTDTSPQDLGTLPFFVNSFAHDVNDAGVIVGHCDDLPIGPFGGLGPVGPAVIERAFVWEDRNANGPDAADMRDLNDLIPAESGWILERATGISNTGFIVGLGWFNGTRRVFRLTPLDTAPPTLSNCSVTPASRNALGGQFTLSIEATDASGVAEVVAKVTTPAMTIDTVTLTQVGMTNVYSGTYNAPANTTAMDLVYPVSFEAEDPSENKQTQACGSFTVLKNAAPAIPACDVSPNSRGPAGGEFTVTATVTDDIAVTSVFASINGPNMIPSASMALDSGTAQNGVYKGTFNLPANSSGSVQTYYVNVTAQDGLSGETTEFCEAVQVDPNQPPTIKICDVTPDSLPATGGTFTVSATVLDDVGVTCVEAEVDGPNPVGTVTLTLQSGTATNGVWQGTFDVPANGTASPQLYEVDVTAKDGLGGSTTEDCETVSVAGAVLDNQPPVIHDCTFDPQFLPNSGGDVFIQALVSDNQGVATVRARVQKPIGGTAETLLHGKEGLYDGAHTVGVAVSSAPAFLQVEIVAEDAVGNTATVVCGVVRLAGTGEAPPGFVSVSPRVINFGKVFIGKTPIKPVVLSHSGGSPGALFVFRHTFPVTPFGLLGAGPSVAGTHPALSGFNVIASGASKHLKVKFSPKEIGCFEDSLVFLTNDPSQPLIEVKIKGIACKKVKK